MEEWQLQIYWDQIAGLRKVMGEWVRKLNEFLIMNTIQKERGKQPELFKNYILLEDYSFYLYFTTGLIVIVNTHIENCNKIEQQLNQTKQATRKKRTSNSSRNRKNHHHDQITKQKKQCNI